jgi:hypothetical protein
MGVYLPFGIYGVHRDANLYWLSVKPENQNGNFFSSRFNRLLQPFRLVSPAIPVMLAFNRVEWDVDVGEVRGLVLIQVALAAEVNALELKKNINFFHDGPFKGSTLGAAQC